MMIITMAPSDTPTTSTCSISHDTKATEQRVPPVLCSNSSISDKNNSNTFSNNSGALSNISSSNRDNTRPTNKRRVSFSFQQNAYFTPEQQLTNEERKNECWYSEVELNASRNDARMAIQALHHQLQMDAAAAAAGTYGRTESETEEESSTSSDYGSDDMSSSDGSSTTSSSTGSNSNNNNNSGWLLRCPQDKTKIVCLRGIEKYADAAAKYTGQKRLVSSVLQQQSLNNKDIHISLVSRTLSEPFKEVARYYAMKSADELNLSRKLEEEQQQETERKQREEVASVLLLIMGMGHQQQQQQQQQNDVPNLMPLSSPRKSISCTSSSYSQDSRSPIVTPRSGGSTSRPTIPSLKRNSPTNCPSLSERRNVKPCIR
jgi:hypothetical protein